MEGIFKGIGPLSWFPTCKCDLSSVLQIWLLAYADGESTWGFFIYVLVNNHTQQKCFQYD